MIDNSYKHPSDGCWGECCNYVLNNKSILTGRRKLFSYLPFLKLQSDVTDVVYMNWLIDIDVFQDYIPEGVTILEKQGRALFTILTYKHHHFSPAFLGSLRKLFPSPLQSNWRLYVDQLPKKLKHEQGTVLFLKNILDSNLFAIGSRLFSDALPSHCADSFKHARQKNGYETVITAGIGSAPELQAYLTEVDTQNCLPVEFEHYFGDMQKTLEFICLQSSAISSISSTKSIAYAGIDLPVDISTIKPLLLNRIHVPFLDTLGGNLSQPFCFVVPNVPFTVLWEKVL